MLQEVVTDWRTWFKLSPPAARPKLRLLLAGPISVYKRDGDGWSWGGKGGLGNVLRGSFGWEPSAADVENDRLLDEWIAEQNALGAEDGRGRPGRDPSG
jgi:hypothetical protein